MENVKRASHDFFGLPVEERRKYLKENSRTQSVMLKTSFSPLAEKVLEWKDYLVHLVVPEIDDADFALWPSVTRYVLVAVYGLVLQLDKICLGPVSEYINRVKPIIRKLLETLLKGINMTQKIYEAKESALMGSLLTTLLHYPKCPNPELDNIGGLYVQLSGPIEEWAHVTPVDGSLVVNIGNVLEIMSNGRYKSVEHRVFVDGNRDRVSVPVFANPSADAVIGPLPEVMEDGEKPVYRRLVYSDYLGYFFSKGHDGKRTIDFARV
ncbi:2-oxoglutarate (2OG) and Fe(II)-dependent oxygenase superfamily protein [Striga asiatica]|uniref:2-oxoglutarate (2OG) and Fe(II)-dependent oxygenase superfamily protein n=1 Tax=Striga asiatica TaxID=4170 RepID=A0A5A7P7U9_STRAF|nr:2-oxoglutarate (2OG) and Fe(II)-dependent oxygenase superfamily protein [Striga asiatica]